MWECFNCSYQNVDAAPVCGKCRVPKPDPNAPRQGRSYYASSVAAQERAADEAMQTAIPPAPTARKIREKWDAATADRGLVAEEIALLERRTYAIRESLRILIGVLKSPQARGNDALLNNVLNTLVDWEREP
jgi:hypothetical protein